MRRDIAFVAMFVTLAVGFYLGQLSKSDPAARPANLHYPEAITVSFPDPHASGGRRVERLQVVEMGSDPHPADVTKIKADDWSITSHPKTGDSRNSTIYYARPE